MGKASSGEYEVMYGELTKDASQPFFRLFNAPTLAIAAAKMLISVLEFEYVPLAEINERIKQAS